MHHNVYGDCFLVKEDHEDEQSLAGRAAAPIPTGWKRQPGSSYWTLCMAVAVETADKTAEQICRGEHSPTATGTGGLDFFRETLRLDERSPRRMPCGVCANAVRSCVSGETDNVHGLERQDYCYQLRQLDRFGKKTVIWNNPTMCGASVLLQIRAFLVPTAEGTTDSACVFGSPCSWRRGHEKLGGIGQRWLEHVPVVRKMRCRDNGEEDKLLCRLARRENSWALGFMICWMDREPVVQSLDRSLRPCAKNERTAKNEGDSVERHRLQGMGKCEKCKDQHAA